MQFRLPEPVVSDNCAGDVTLKAYVGSSEIDVNTYQFENEGTTVVTFEAVDNCGNVATANVNVVRKACLDPNLQYGKSKDLNEIRFKVYPNPFETIVKFEICLPFDSNVRIDIFSYNGTFIAEILNDNLNRGDVRIVEFNASNYPHTAFIYKVTTKMTWFNGTIIKAN